MAEKNTALSWTLRYIVATLGLILVALGVALSLKSNLGTAPVSCPPAVLNLKWGAISVGTFTWMMHVVFIISQMLMSRKLFEYNYLLQLLAAFFFGYLCDGAIWLLKDLQVSGYAGKMCLCILTVIVTAVGVRMEVLANAWMLAGEKTTVVLAEVTGIKFSNVKVCFDVFLVVISALFALLVFRNLFGNGEAVVIREGTLILAVCTGLCMKLTDPLVDKVFGRICGKA